MLIQLVKTQLYSKGWGAKPDHNQTAFLLAEQNTGDSRQILQAYSRFLFKISFNLERLGQPNVGSNLVIAARSRALSRVKRIGQDNLTPGSGQG